MYLRLNQSPTNEGTEMEHLDTLAEDSADYKVSTSTTNS